MTRGSGAMRTPAAHPDRTPAALRPVPAPPHPSGTRPTTGRVGRRTVEPGRHLLPGGPRRTHPTPLLAIGRQSPPEALDDGLDETLVGERFYAPTEATAAVGVSRQWARRYWRALGFPQVGDDDIAFSDADVEALARIAALVQDGPLDEDTALSLTRALARSCDQLAVWSAQALSDMVHEHGDADGSVNTADLMARIAPDLEPLLLHAWRRHLATALTHIDNHDRPSRCPHHGSIVGFADMVGFTHTVRKLTDSEVGELVQRFEVTTSDVISAYGGRLVKTIGDEVLFSCQDAYAAAGIGLALIEAARTDRALPALRIGLAQGPVVSRLGDLFGTTVNRAARLTSLARPGTILSDSEAARGLTDRDEFRLIPLRARELRGLGPTRAYVVRSTHDLPPPPRPRASSNTKLTSHFPPRTFPWPAPLRRDQEKDQ
ncbi:hypothetical protein KEM60_01570 [Austwickia sp. TVS 96-490-7B]|uniref:adenylate/guanylate cyclase domain-containing protein n=1 Tax=Austwickia sp. TVS 96-490-7B TaxID=2830843 RepID=UPI001C5A2403|nr:adenylate/guanylate cyclase domain-containing protein [Austwickia sp. TVS 96-490-7B]MBW3085373.1 hypothetical protein [Austwickia sp. TVS 96-490-7B]